MQIWKKHGLKTLGMSRSRQWLPRTLYPKILE